MRIVFMGTPDFAVPVFKRMIADGHEVCGVFTQPDKPRGRGYTLCPPPVAVAAGEAGVPVFQPATLKDGEAARIIGEMAPQVIVVAAYGKILPEAVLNIPPLGCINVHASLLPRYRGAAPIQWAVINGERVTGVTTMYMAKGLDTGDMILKAETPIGPEEDGGSLYARLSEMGAELLARTLPLLEKGEAPREQQDDSLACYAPMIDKSVAAVDFRKSARQVHDRIRGLSPHPGATAVLRGQTVKIFGSLLPGEGAPEEMPAGTVLSASAEEGGGIVVCCGDHQLVKLTQVQGPGGKRMAAAAYLRGHPVAPGECFRI